MHLRSWRPGDAASAASLLDARPDALWVAQFHALHGPDCDGPDWRRTVVATDAGDRMIGCATVVANRLHPGRYPCAIEVEPAYRRRGIGTQLLTAIRSARPERRPLSTKVRPGDAAAQGFLSRAGGRVYQRCPGVAVDPRDPVVRRWVAQQAVDRCTNLSGLTPVSLAAVFARQYAWVHESWSPVGDAELLAQVAAEEVSEADLDMSFGAWVADRLAAVAFAFPSEVGIEVVAETAEPDGPDGPRLVAAAIAALLERATRCGGLVRFDGHVSDPHLNPVLLRIPWHCADPVELVEMQ